MTKNRTTNILNLLLIILLMVVTIFSIVLINNFPIDNYLRKLSSLLVFNLIINLTALNYKKNSFLNISSIFIILLYVFNYGQIFVYGMPKNYRSSRFNFISLIHQDELNSMIIFSILIINFTAIGMLLNNKNKNKNLYKNTNKINYSNEEIFRIGKQLLIFSLPFFCFTVYKSLKKGFTVGYGQADTFQGEGLINVFSYFIYSSLFLLSESTKCRKKKNKLYLFTFCISVILMFSGHRSRPLTFLLSFYLISKEKVIDNNYNLKKNLLYIFLAYIVILISNSVFQIRNNPIEFSSIFTGMKNNGIFKSFLTMLEELGGSIYTLQLTMRNVPLNIKPQYGGTFIASIFSLIPNLRGYFTEINHYSHFVYSLNTHALGGSYIAELFYNFKWAAPPFALLIGAVIQKTDNKAEIYTNERNMFKLACYIQLYAYILWWVRDSFMSILRPFVYCMITIYLIIEVNRKKW